MARSLLSFWPIAALLAACGSQSTGPADDNAAKAPATREAPPSPSDAAAAAGAAAHAAGPQPIALAITRAEWGKAANRARCAPLLLTDDGGAHGTPRRANMSGGWGVAFDQPGLRSAYGVAGAGVDVKDAAAEAKRIKELWPYVRPLGARAAGLPAGTLAGYGLDGAAPFDPGNPTGKGQRMGAYVVIPGQGCLYNLWSHLGREQMERMLDGLTLDARP